MAEAFFQFTFQTSTHQGQTDKPQTGLLAMPAEVIKQLGFGLSAQSPELTMEVILLENVPEPLDAPVVKQVLHAGVLANLPIPVVALKREDRLAHVEDVGSLHIAERVCGSRERLLLVMGSSHTATDVDVASPQRSGRVCEHHKTDVLGQQVHGVISRNRDSNLELSGQIGVAVQRLICASGENTAL